MPRASMPNSLVIRGLTKEYVPGKPVLSDIDLAFGETCINAIIGPSGTGKSTLIRCINRLVEPTSGEILFDGADLARLVGTPLRQARRHIGMGHPTGGAGLAVLGCRQVTLVLKLLEVIEQPYGDVDGEAGEIAHAHFNCSTSSASRASRNVARTRCRAASGNASASRAP